MKGLFRIKRNSCYFPRIEIGTASSSGITVVTIATTTGAGQPAGFNISCQKQGADYIGKTAKEVASDANVRSIGAVGVDIQSVTFGSGINCTSNCTTGTCTICKRTGAKITSVVWNSTGGYYVNGIDALNKYSCSVNGRSAGVGGLSGWQEDLYSTSSAAFLQFMNGTTAYNVATGVVTCIGVP